MPTWLEVIMGIFSLIGMILVFLFLKYSIEDWWSVRKQRKKNIERLIDFLICHERRLLQLMERGRKK